MTDATTPTMDPRRARLRAMVRSCYDLQKLRIQSGLRLCANFRAELGQTAGDTEDELPDEAKNILQSLRQSYARITDGIAKNRSLPPKDKFKADGLITEYTIARLVDSYLQLERVERQQFSHLAEFLPEFPVWTAFLEPIRGLGPAMAGVIISEFDIRRARYPSSLWAYAGLDVGSDGLGRSRRAAHLIDREYTDAEGEIKTKKSITYNPFLKTKLMGVMAGNFLKSTSPYADIYRSYKHRLETDPAKTEWSKGRRHNAAMRYMVKMFLIDLYKAWRTIENLPVSPSYQEGKLGRTHGGAE